MMKIISARRGSIFGHLVLPAAGAFMVLNFLAVAHAAGEKPDRQQQEDEGVVTAQPSASEQAAAQKARTPVLNEGIAKPTRVDEVVVTATRTEKAKRDVAGSVSTYAAGGAQMELAPNYRDLVSDDLDVSTTNNVGGKGAGGRSAAGLQGYTIRGIDGNRILIQTDGIRQADQYTFGGTYSLGRNYQDLSSLKRVEILKGSASSLYGSDAIGGVVTYITKDPSDFLTGKKEPYYFDATSAFDSASMEFAETATAAVRAGNDVQILGLFTRRDGNETQNMGSYGANPLNYGSNNALGKVAWQANEFNRLVFTGEYFDRDTNAALNNQLGSYTNGGVNINRSSVLQDTSSERWRASVSHRFERPEETPVFDAFTWQGYYQPTENTEETDERYVRNGTTPYLRQFHRDYIDNIGGGSIQFEKRFETGAWAHLMTYGTDVSLSHLERNVDGLLTDLGTGATSSSFGTRPSTFGPYFMPYKEIPDSDVLRFGLYAQDEIDLGAEKVFSVVPGLRLDYYDLSVDNDESYTKVTGENGVGYNEWSLSPKLALIGRPEKEITVYSQFAQGFRSPTTEELNAVFNNFTENYVVTPNPNLKSETSYNFETGVRFDYPFVKSSLAGYYNYYRDFINQQTYVGTNGSGQSIFQSTNISEAQIFGTTLNTEWPLGVYNPGLEGVSFLFGTAFAWGQDLENDQPLDSVDPWKLMSGLRYTNKKFGVELRNTFVGAKSSISETMPTQFRPPQYNTIDLIGWVNVAPHAKVTLGLYNLTNEKYWVWQDVRGIDSTGNAPSGATSLVNQVDLFTQPGFTVRGSVSITF
jgi:hemoglobin/transferrin/lactoferrin receptor protein